MCDENEEGYYEIRKCINMIDAKKIYVNLSLDMLKEIVLKELKEQKRIYEFTVSY